MLKKHRHLKERRTISVQTPWTTTAFAQPPLWAPTELLLPGRRPYCVAMVTIRRPHCSLIRPPSHCVCFELAQNAHQRPVFYAIPQRLLAMPLCCCGDVAIVLHTLFLGRCGIAVRTLLWYDRGFTPLFLECESN